MVCISTICARSSGSSKARALAALKAQARHGRPPTDLSPERVQQLEQELAEKTRALVELSISFTLLEKKRSCGVTGLYAGQRLSASEQQVICQMITEAQAAGLTTQKGVCRDRPVAADPATLAGPRARVRRRAGSGGARHAPTASLQCAHGE